MKTLRAWATPLIIGSFLVMAVSGTMIFFHVETALMKALHEWAGWVMLAGAAAHLALNWRPFIAYFRRPLAAGIVGVSALLLALSVLPVGPEQSPGDFTRLAFGALSGGQIATLAELAGSDTATVLADLGAAGIDARATDTPAGLAGGDRMAQMQILGTIFDR